ncbi:PqqD family protein [Haloimpatiens sp. FM7315]|uniref:PqqD family protein n=1 Tax=Haloimpatiens sp. FM7315 TaxID=3298609 RepID=UPI0035A37B49
MYIKNKNLVEKDFEDKKLVLNLQDEQVYELKDVEIDIWNGIDELKEFNEISNVICNKYRVDKELVNKDLNEFLNQLMVNELIIKE